MNDVCLQESSIQQHQIRIFTATYAKYKKVLNPIKSKETIKKSSLYLKNEWNVRSLLSDARQWSAEVSLKLRVHKTSDHAEPNCTALAWLATKCAAGQRRARNVPNAKTHNSGSFTESWRQWRKNK